MFNFGLFATHIPYVVFVMAYMVYFGSNLLGHPERITAAEEDLNIASYSEFKAESNQHSTYFFHQTMEESDGYAYDDFNIPSPDIVLQTFSACTKKIRLQDNYAHFITSRPPPFAII